MQQPNNADAATAPSPDASLVEAWLGSTADAFRRLEAALRVEFPAAVAEARVIARDSCPEIFGG